MPGDVSTCSARGKYFFTQVNTSILVVLVDRGSERKRKTDIDRQVDRKTDRHTRKRGRDRQTDRQTNRQTDRQTDKLTGM
jgi:hypothetical protein